MNPKQVFMADDETSNSVMRKLGSLYMATNAIVIGDVIIGEDTNIWPYVCIRGDVAAIRIGNCCSIQDFVMIHCRHLVSLEIGNNVIIGHQACVHCKIIGDDTLVGIGAKILDNAVVGKRCLIAAGSVVRPGTVIPDDHMVAGIPAKIIRKLRENDYIYHQNVINRYLVLAKEHVEGKFTQLMPNQIQAI